MSKIKPPDLEVSVGLSVYKSDTLGVGGKLKTTPEDFIVEEITKEGVVVSLDEDEYGDVTPGEFTHFTLVKKNWDTMRALKQISRKVGVSQKRFSFAGTKDKQALTAQRVSVRDVSIEALDNVRLKDLTLKDFSYADYPVEMGGLWGNRFTVVIRDVELPESEVKERVEETQASLSGGFPNFFGLQRFGVVRPITHLVGKKIVQGDFEGAVRTYLCKTFEGVSVEEKKAREELAKTWDIKTALKKFPKRLGYETALLNHLLEKPGDYRGALGRLPMNLQSMFVHAFQAYVFNKALGACIKKDIFVERLPLVGYESKPDPESSQILEEEKIDLGNFKIKAFPRLSSRGGVRHCFEEMKDFEVFSWKPLKLCFSLPAACYATVVLREFMKNRYW